MEKYHMILGYKGHGNWKNREIEMLRWVKFDSIEEAKLDYEAYCSYDNTIFLKKIVKLEETPRVDDLLLSNPYVKQNEWGYLSYV